MVCVNYRIVYGIENERIIDFFKEIGYSYRRSNKKAVKVGDDYIPTEEFLRYKNSGRFHLFIAFGKKNSGTEAYPQVKVLLHFDIIKIVKGKETYFLDNNEKRNIKEIYRIEEELVKNGIGFLEEKDKKCAHHTLKAFYIEKFLKVVHRGYKRYAKGKYRKRFNSSQCFISLIEQKGYIHIICVFATIKGKEHNLNRKKSEKELERILASMLDEKN